jgi:hypothetical protein
MKVQDGKSLRYTVVDGENEAKLIELDQASWTLRHVWAAPTHVAFSG